MELTYKDDRCVEFRQPASWTWIITVPLFLAGMVVFLRFGIPFMKYEKVFDHWLGILIFGAIGLSLLCGTICWLSRNFIRIGCRVNGDARQLTRETFLFTLPLPAGTVQVEDDCVLHLHGVVHLRDNVAYRRDYFLDLYRGKRHLMRIGRAQDEKSSLETMAIEVAQALDIPAWDQTYSDPLLLNMGSALRSLIARAALSDAPETAS